MIMTTTSIEHRSVPRSRLYPATRCSNLHRYCLGMLYSLSDQQASFKKPGETSKSKPVLNSSVVMVGEAVRQPRNAGRGDNARPITARLSVVRLVQH